MGALGGHEHTKRAPTLSGSFVSLQARPRTVVQTTTARQALCSTQDRAPCGGPRSSTGREGPTTRPPIPTRSPAPTPVLLLLKTTTSANEWVCCLGGSWAVWQRAQHSVGPHASLHGDRVTWSHLAAAAPVDGVSCNRVPMSFCCPAAYLPGKSLVVDSCQVLTGVYDNTPSKRSSVRPVEAVPHAHLLL